MPTVTLSLRSQRSKPVPDDVRFTEVRGRSSGPVQSSEIELKAGEIVLDLVPDHYTINIEVGGLRVARGQLQVGTQAMARLFPVENDVSTLPKVSELETEQKRLLQSLDGTKTPGEIWDALTDNKAATLFQVTYALTEVDVNGGPLSSAIGRVVRVGGAELTAPDTSGVSRK